MDTFEVRHLDGTVYEVQAPDEQSAIDAFTKHFDLGRSRTADLGAYVGNQGLPDYNPEYSDIGAAAVRHPRLTMGAVLSAPAVATAPIWGPPVAAGALTAGRYIWPYAGSAAAGAAGSALASHGAPDWLVNLAKDLALGLTLRGTEKK